MKIISVSFVAILLVCWATAADYHEDILGNISGNPANDQTVQVSSVPLKIQDRIIEFNAVVSVPTYTKKMSTAILRKMYYT